MDDKSSSDFKKILGGRVTFFLLFFLGFTGCAICTVVLCPFPVLHKSDPCDLVFQMSFLDGVIRNFSSAPKGFLSLDSSLVYSIKIKTYAKKSRSLLGSSPKERFEF